MVVLLCWNWTFFFHQNSARFSTFHASTYVGLFNTFYFLPYEYLLLDTNPYFCLLSFPRHTLEALTAISFYSNVLFVKPTFHWRFPLVHGIYCSSATSPINIFLVFSMSILVYKGKIILIGLSTHFCVLPQIVPADFSWLTTCQSLLCLSVEMRCIVVPCFASPTIPFILTFPIYTISGGKSRR